MWVRSTVGMTVIPAVIPKSLEHLLSLADVLTKAAEVQIDFIDGTYGGDISWPFNGGDHHVELQEIFLQLSSNSVIEVDLMVSSPEKWFPQLIEGQVRRVVVHVEHTNNWEEIFSYEGRICIGLACSNDTPLDVLAEHMDKASFVQCMGIKDIGVQGNAFDERVLSRVAWIRSRYPSLEISVDGHVTIYTLPLLKNVGVTRFVAGSAIFAAEDPIKAFLELQKLADA